MLSVGLDFIDLAVEGIDQFLLAAQLFLQLLVLEFELAQAFGGLGGIVGARGRACESGQGHRASVQSRPGSIVRHFEEKGSNQYAFAKDWRG